MSAVARRHHECVLRRDPVLDARAHHRVDVPLVDDVLGLAVVGAERDPAGPELARRPAAARRGCGQPTPRGSVATSRRAAARGPPLPCRLVVGADPSRRVGVQLACRARRARGRRRAPRRRAGASRARARSPAITPGKFIISATPITRRRRSRPSRSPGVSSRRGDSNRDAGTHDDAITQTSSGTSSHASSSQCTPSVPSTFAISCGSATTAVVPRGSTSRANSSTSSLDDSRCMCASTKPGTTQRPVASSVSRPS